MKKIIRLSLILCLLCTTLALCSCGKDNSEKIDPNEGKLELTEELINEIESGFENYGAGGISVPLCKNGEAIKSRANSTAQMMDISIRFDSYDIKSYEKADDYNYEVNIVLKSEDESVTTVAELYFVEADNDSGYALQVYCSGLNEKLRKLEG